MAWTFFLATAGIGLSRADPSRGKTPPPRPPLSKLDVGALGYRPWSVHEAEIEHRFSVGQLHFLSADRLVVTFVSHVVPPTLPRRGQPEVASSLELNALFINATTGKLEATRKWPTTAERSRIAPAPKGGFVVITPDKLVLYSPTMQPIGELNIPVGREASETFWDAVPSPRGDYILIWYDSRDGRHCTFELVNTQSMEVTGSGPNDHGPGSIPVYAVLDDGTMLADNSRGALVLEPPRGPWREPQFAWSPGCKAWWHLPVSGQALFGGRTLGIERWCYSLALTTGEVVFELPLPEKEMARYVTGSGSRERLALAIEKGRGGSWLLDIPDRYSLNRITVYDIQSRQWIFSLQGKVQHIRSISGLALSPDGSNLALIDQDGILRVYEVEAGKTVSGENGVR